MLVAAHEDISPWLTVCVRLLLSLVPSDCMPCRFELFWAPCTLTVPVGLHRDTSNMYWDRSHSVNHL